MYLVDEMLSPLITPFVLYFQLRNRSGQVIDFLRNFTIDVSGMWKCVSAKMQMSLASVYWFNRCRRCLLLRWNGCPKARPSRCELSAFYSFPVPCHVCVFPPQWQVTPLTHASRQEQAELGKTEMSLIQFSVSVHGFVSLMCNRLHLISIGSTTTLGGSQERMPVHSWTRSRNQVCGSVMVAFLKDILAAVVCGLQLKRCTRACKNLFLTLFPPICRQYRS